MIITYHNDYSYYYTFLLGWITEIVQSEFIWLHLFIHLVTTIINGIISYEIINVILFWWCAKSFEAL